MPHHQTSNLRERFGLRTGGQFREALGQARHDPDLARWFDEQRELDNRIGTTLRTALAPPPELKSNLLPS
jgi:hypothetical protein